MRISILRRRRTKACSPPSAASWRRSSLGFGDWRVATAILTGFTAKETLVSTLSVLVGEDIAGLQALFTPFTALVFLVFVLLYTPCVAAIATVKRELGGKNALYTVVTQCVIAWCVAFLVHVLGTALGLH